ncbi:unnamed protein product (macronuclear) [Paramecium tetraurelia]|uniref:ERCC4 domain-containing protein n=1 Tax=Paramecium tetraurelia TaxID=5888 RepID=A0CPJ6_PARTE|nr:uncharacterized protein GSPATT00009105001 [Paramecium tetraurelia]CAK72713.1 unnamed protein product [Paramecium tetraurelia]|eukprot:XP_001440110.1 hypothetical protein (macronuclear) [Paramecium tetraurelia strain d4-2]
MISELIEKNQFNDFYILFDDNVKDANKTVKSFYEQFESEYCQKGSENFNNPNKFKIYINETMNKGRSKQNVSSIIEKYSKNKNLESSKVFMQSCQRSPFLCLIVMTKEQFKSLDNILELVVTHKENDSKTIIILEEIKELIYAQNQFVQYQQEFDQFVLDLQLNNKVDVINTKSQKQTIEEIAQCLLCSVQWKKKQNKIPCLFRDRGDFSLFKAENAGITNTYELYWMAMLTQIPGISEAKARAIVLKYPSVKSLINAYKNTDIEKRPHLLSEIEVVQGIVQQTSKKLGNTISEQLYILFSTTNADYKVLD